MFNLQRKKLSVSKQFVRLRFTKKNAIFPSSLAFFSFGHYFFLL